jgi:hypothetical protein
MISIPDVPHLGHGVDREREPVVELAIRMKAYQVVSEETGSFPCKYQQNLIKQHLTILTLNINSG